ncbi:MULTISPECIES: hypothetical protein [Streptomyces]|uniref:hypothetical protein n=1 Tax=Streptomyces TaxID=1883 RepID=UPI0002DD18CF|nr:MULTISPECIES: hypothetical protein [Streptomyces]MZE79675.1 hypothetical protein [Streptomyces sp. SID5475]MCC3651850.1 hypothetical protein [Streptomyces sp. S07_1.15]MCC5035397.1 hypothetical protein [Streptomyces sp. WAC 00631]MCC9739546.1 hypothetical protein [Streptomyces sp. MNU89]WSQ73416.1 hypothetical protein OG463_19635 [Streptomyces xinghaiensis]
MLWEALGSVLIGLAVASAGVRWLSGRLPASPLVYATGPVAALFGCLITRTVVGPDHALASLTGALVVAAALLSLLVRRPGRMRRSAAA